jgi:6,7-dimethyl-8-ribityllumazine synthase
MALDPKSKERPQRARPGSRIAVVVSRFHEDLTGAMLASARRELEARGLRAEDIDVAWVPGSFELAIVARRFARRGDVDAVVCFGLVLKGETEHDHWVAAGTVQALVQASLETDVPIHFGVLTCATLEQARARALPVDRGGREDKGREVAAAAIETLLALDQVGARQAQRGNPQAQVSPQPGMNPRADSNRRAEIEGRQA